VRPIRIVVLSILCALLAASLAACGPDAPPDVYRGSECPLSAQIQEAWAGTGDEHWAVDTAIRESRCNPDAYNQSGATGVFQLMMPLHARFVGDVCGDPGLVWDATCNITAARIMYDGQGRRPWNF
jgi:soluble lytic murein transglycosylase-like protein